MTFPHFAPVPVICFALAFGSGCRSVEMALPEGVEFVRGPVNGVLIETSGGRVAIYGDPRPEPEPAGTVLLTHHRRDVVWAARELIRSGALVHAPAAERALFEGVENFWREFQTARFHDYAQQSTKILTQSMRVDRFVAQGARLEFGGVEAEVMETPGYTRGAVSYLIETGGVRIACTGDLIHEGGRIYDLYSLQDAIPEANVRGYHGYAARAADVIESLRKLAAWKPDIILPARGPAIDNPDQAIAQLTARLQELFRNYYRTDALRWYWGDDNLRLRAGRVLSDAAVEWMPAARELREIPPRWLHKLNTSRLIVSDSGPAFLIDCGYDAVMEELREMRSRGVYSRIEGIFVTHYHDDHTDRVQAMAEECNCPVYAGPEVADILERPGAYRMPAQTGIAVRDVRVLGEGETLPWREYTFRSTYFPGQAVYHGGLQVEREDGEKLFFIGDSFSPTGLDDYCILNRHFLHPDLGHFLCLRKIREAGPDYWLVNQHIEPVFRYSDEQLDTMERTLEAKRATAAELVPWEDPNFGLDEQWARLYPYGVEARAGEPFELWAVVFNHSPQERRFRFALNLPDGWTAEESETDFAVAPRKEGRTRFLVTPPAGAAGLTVLTADTSAGDVDLREWTEALVEIR